MHLAMVFILFHLPDQHRKRQVWLAYVMPAALAGHSAYLV